MDVAELVLSFCKCGHRVMYHSMQSGRDGCHQCSCRKTWARETEALGEAERKAGKPA